MLLFQSTRSARSATSYESELAQTESDFNPRAPRGARLCPKCGFEWSKYFNPRAPRGARQQAVTDSTTSDIISIHALREERDR